MYIAPVGSRSRVPWLQCIFAAANIIEGSENSSKKSVLSLKQSFVAIEPVSPDMDCPCRGQIASSLATRASWTRLHLSTFRTNLEIYDHL